MSEQEQEQKETRKVVYTGFRYDASDGKTFYCFKELDEQEKATGKNLMYSKNVTKDSTPGGVYLLTFTGRSVLLNGPHAPKYVGLYPDETQRRAWRADQWAAEQERQKANLKKKEMSDDFLAASLTNILPVFEKCGTAGRQAIIAAIGEYLWSTTNRRQEAALNERIRQADARRERETAQLRRELGKAELKAAK